MSEAKILQFPKTMRTYITLMEQADADDMHGDASHPISFGRQDGQGFSDRGRADTKSRPNDPRYADNPMTIDEFAESEVEPQLDRIHRALNKVGYTDLEIRQGVDLTHEGKSKIAAALGISIEEVDLYVNSLIQNLNDADGNDTDALLSDYYGGMSEGADAPIWTGRLSEKKNWAFDDDDDDDDKETAKERDKRKKDARREKEAKKKSVTENRFSAEPDTLGNVTIRDQKTGKERFIQGSAASEILNKLEDGDPDQVLAPLMEYAMNTETNDDAKGFADEINAQAGSYNFAWDYASETGTGTVVYSLKNERPEFKMVSVRTSEGDDILDGLDSGEYKNILGQAKRFIDQA